MKAIFFNNAQRLRNGWWLLIFVGFVALTRFAYGPTTHFLKSLGATPFWLEPAPFLFSLLATWACTRLRREPLGSVGFALDKRWFAEIGVGCALGAASMLLVAGVIWLAGGVRFELDAARSLTSLAYGLYVFGFAALLEETLFRGFLFQRLLDGAGVWVAQLTLALLFAIAHWTNPEMHGAVRVWATVDIFLGAIMLGLAYLRTRSLALPVGLHLGWNWTQGQVLGFGVSGYDQSGWWQPVLQSVPEWLNGGKFGPESSVFSVASSLLMIAALWYWRGTVASRLPRAASATARLPHQMHHDLR